ncbi:elongation factor Ts [Candidatus Kuenenia stuttgartiensis]|jgi:elongation factor Ts|uniref:Elongation factor Ts n=1 Tax=Kuenenia stuttgartiensis TaxID=174633 RepID=Q1Q2J4_KUEST|nr:translation elongation factor Ts [Candidatus Kuenenia stuttgartiensis]MBE7548838.1 elongation factor Ts [Planctomycetia bacterium]MBW7942970.1 elongation factor Ts [Candidatus Kuenenia stuttgartiensis]MBZ0190757.1 elongation factor Ts [Candidatus Kuenenia stuttgartiensis]MCF6153627.1 elongation factor Ts [Candidatus Kuenenia stuttgartiensis]MCL4728787.1 elongation factor Ts [Candidatus Kuenenia stuttgartiensis]
MADKASVMKLREQTGAGILECKNALDEVNDDYDKALEIIKKKGFAKASRKEQRTTAEGRIGSYIHTNGKIGVMVEVNCETDFVARNEVFQQFLKDICMQIAATNPIAIKREDISSEIVETQKRGFIEDTKGKPSDISEKIVKGKLENFYKEKCLLEQPFIKDDSQTIQDLLIAIIAKIGENIKINRFARLEVGGK